MKRVLLKITIIFAFCAVLTGDFCLLRQISYQKAFRLLLQKLHLMKVPFILFC